ncbi:MAG: hypothetical protein SGILL_004626 [Bacillariaceae sp.]
MQDRRGLSGDAGYENSGGASKKRKGNADIPLTQEELEELEKRKARLKKLRQEREEKRRLRSVVIRSSGGKKRRRRRPSSKIKKRRNDDDLDEGEEEFEVGEEKKQDEQAAEVNNTEFIPSDATTEPTIGGVTAAPPQRTGTVECPLCQKSIPVPPLPADSDDPPDEVHQQQEQDAVLAEHMSSCQTTERPSRRRRGRQKSASTNVAGEALRTKQSEKTRPNYAEHDDNDIGFDDYDSSSDSSNFNGGAVDLTEDTEDDTLDADVVDDDGDDGIVDATSSGRYATTISSKVATAVDDWNEGDYEDRVEEWIENGLDNMKIMKEQDESEAPPGEEVYDGGLVVPAWVNDRLFPYQRTGLQWMWELHRQQSGGILGDEMGLGKTIQVVSFLGAMAASRKIRSVLIIAPATMLQHWLQEMAKWAPGIRRLLIHSSGDSNAGPFLSMGRSNITTQKLTATDEWLKDCRRNRLFEIIDEDDLKTRDASEFCGTAYAFVTTFENVRRNEEIWARHRWSYVIMDEAQKIRNPNADITLVCKRLKTPHRLALSGTPIQNDLRELWSIFDFVFPQRLGTLPVFETEFADPIKRGGYTNASPMQVQLAYRCALILKDLINPYLLRRLKKDIKEVQRMPGKREQVLFCRLSDQQREMYEAFLHSDLVKRVFRGSAQLLGAITMMRKICNHPDLVCPPSRSSLNTFLQNGCVNENQISQEGDSDDYMSDEEMLDDDEDGMQSFVERSGKLEVLAKILPIWKKQGHRVLIFCQWRKMLDLIQRFVQMNDWKYGRLDGNTNVASRQRLVNKFNDDDSYFAMLCTTRTGGVGLNLTEREVTIYRLITAGSVEEKMYQRQIFKTALSNSVLQDPRQRRLFSQKDLKDLFTLKADNGTVLSGGGGMTETSQMTKGTGYVDPQEKVSTEDEKDDGEIMKNVLQTQGLAGVFDHGAVESNDIHKRQSVREMEDKAKSIAREALQNISKSTVGQDVFDPESRFGGNSMQSGGLLSTIAQHNDDVKDATSSSKSGDMKQYTKLLKDLKEFVRFNVPTTDEILEEFSAQISAFDAAIFRRLLKSVASLKNGRWKPK